MGVGVGIRRRSISVHNLIMHNKQRREKKPGARDASASRSLLVVLGSSSRLVAVLSLSLSEEEVEVVVTVAAVAAIVVVVELCWWLMLIQLNHCWCCHMVRVAHMILLVRIYILGKVSGWESWASFEVHLIDVFSL